MFFDNEHYLRFRDRARARGLQIPIVPGIFPIHSFPAVARFADRCGASVPQRVAERFAGLDEDAETTHKIATELATEQITELAAHGVDQVHIYTLNRADLAVAVCEQLGIASKSGGRMSAADSLRVAAADRILVLDGASGTEFQALRTSEDDLRGTRFHDHPSSLAGNHDLLVLTQPDAVVELHLSYLLAGADIITTNTFSSTTVAQREYGLDDPALIGELNSTAAQLARRAADDAHRRDGRQRWVAGAIGPTNVTLSMSPRVEDPGYRTMTFRDVADSYRYQIAGLVEGGVDVLLIETIFDTLNAKAAIWAARRHAADTGIATPLMISGTITDRSGRTLSGQTPAAFWQSVRHSDPISVGLNCALGGADMRPYIQELANVADTLICAYPNAGLPNALGCYDETPDQTATILGEFADAGFRQHRRRLLWHDTGTRHRDRRRGRGQDATRAGRAASRPAAVGSRAVHAHRRHPVRQRRRTDQRHRVGEVPPVDHQR